MEPTCLEDNETKQRPAKAGHLEHRDFLASVLPQLESRVAGLPFDILPQGIDLTNNLDWLRDESVGDQIDIMSSLQESIPFQFDTIVTRQGSNVLERRGTAWVAEEGIGALAYSGKLMPPSPLAPLVRNIMRNVEDAIDAPMKPFFDCALCNYYPDGESACKFHTDPEHGKVWERLNCVVAVGSARRFAFRPIDTPWGHWDSSSRAGKVIDEQSQNTNKDPAVIRLFPGDIVQMYRACNDDFHHAVYPENNDSSGMTRQNATRVSLVLKRAISRGSNGQKGHGLAGEGRRSRGKRSRE